MAAEVPQSTARPERLVATAHDDGLDAAVAAARRVLSALLLAGDRSETSMDCVAKQLHTVADEVEEHAPPLETRMVHMWEGDGVTRHDPVTGPENAIAPPLTLTGRGDGAIEGTLTLGLPYQGPPGCVHGGVSALVLDHTLGVANHWGGLSGMTAKLTLRYHRPAPLFEPLTVTGQQVSVDGVKIRTVGAISAGGRDCVTAEGLFIAKERPRPR